MQVCIQSVKLVHTQANSSNQMKVTESSGRTFRTQAGLQRATAIVSRGGLIDDVEVEIDPPNSFHLGITPEATDWTNGKIGIRNSP